MKAIFKALYELEQARKWFDFTICVALSLIVSILDAAFISGLGFLVGKVLNGGADKPKFLAFLSSSDFVLNDPKLLGKCLLGAIASRVLLTGILIARQRKFAEETKKTIVEQTYAKVFKQNYENFIRYDRSRYIHLIGTDATRLSEGFNLVMFFINEVILACSIVAVLFTQSPKVCLFLLAMAGVCYFLVTLPTARHLKTNIRVRKKIELETEKTLFSSVLNFKYLKFLAFPNFYATLYSKYMDDMRDNKIVHEVLIQSPKLVIEALGFAAVVGVMMYLSGGNLDANMISTLTVFAFGTQRLLPCVSKIFQYQSSFHFMEHSLNQLQQVLNLESEESISSAEINLEREIRLLEISLSAGNQQIVKDFNFSITKGMKLGLWGKSGVGKTSLVDAICGLRELQHGSILIDDIPLSPQVASGWRSQIGYVNQDPFIFDGSVKENICFGRTLDEKHLIKSIMSSGLASSEQEAVAVMEKECGDGGCKLSGGQKQRVAIARAFYGGASILVLDEPTSALDSKTSADLTHFLQNMSGDNTLLIISHNKDVLKICHKVLHLKGAGQIEIIDGQQEIVQFCQSYERSRIENQEGQ